MVRPHLLFLLVPCLTFQFMTHCFIPFISHQDIVIIIIVQERDRRALTTLNDRQRRMEKENKTLGPERCETFKLCTYIKLLLLFKI